MKTFSVINDEANRKTIQTFLRALSDEERTPNNFKELCNNPGGLLTKFRDAPTRMSYETARRWMISLGFKATIVSKGWFTDSHERKDVVDLRVQFLEEVAGIELLHSLPHIAHTYVHTQSTSLVVFRTSFRFLTVRQLQLETHFIVANLTLLSHLINYRYYKPKPTSTPLSQPNPLFSPIRLTGSPVAPICPTGQSTFHLRLVRRSRDPA